MAASLTIWTGEAYCAVRESFEGEYFDTTTLGCSQGRVAKRITEMNSLTPIWAERNPVVRIAKIRLEEVPE